MKPPTDELPRGFGLSTAVYLVIASMVGTGILVSPGYMMASLMNHTAALGLWILGGLLSICGALCVAEMATALPRAGGEYVYLREAYGPMPAFLSGWTSFLFGFSAPIAVSGYVAAVYLLTPLGFADGDTDSKYLLKGAAALLIIAITVPNLIGQRQSAWTQALTTVIKLGLFVVLVAFGFLFGSGRFANITGEQPLRDVELSTAATQLFYVMFAYTGWNATSYMAGEVKDPPRILPRSMLLGTGVVTILYLALYLVFAYAVPLEEVGYANAERIPLLAVDNLFGARVSNAFSVAVGLTFLATVSALVITGPRIYFAMARDGLFPSFAGRLSRRGRTPVYGTIAQSVCAIVILFATDFENLYQYASVGLALFTLLFISAVYMLRIRQPSLSRPFRVPGYPIVPGLYIVVTVFMAYFAFKQWRGPSAWCVGTILAGILVYYLWTWFKRRAAPPSGPSEDSGVE